MFKSFRNVPVYSSRSFKNFGHKYQRPPIVTTIWHGFLTFTFIGMAVEWKRISKFFFGNTVPETQEIYAQTADSDVAN